MSSSSSVVDVDHVVVHAPVQRAVGVPDEREAAAHARREVAAGRAEDHRASAGHVLAPVVADAFDDRGRARVAHAEPLADEPADEHVAAGRAVEDDVAGDDVLLGDELRRARRPQHERAARQALAEVVVGVALEPQQDAARHERAEALPRRTLERDVDRAVGQPFAAVATRDLGAEHRADRAVHVADRRTTASPPRRARARRSRPRSARCRAPCRARGPGRASSRSSGRTC